MIVCLLLFHGLCYEETVAGLGLPVRGLNRNDSDNNCDDNELYNNDKLNNNHTTIIITLILTLVITLITRLPVRGLPSGWRERVSEHEPAELGKGQMGSALMGSLQIACVLTFDRGTFWVLPLTYFYPPQECQGVPFSPICQNQNSLLLQRPH